MGAAQGAAARVFRSLDDTAPFRDEVGSRALIYPLDYVFLSSAQFAVVAVSAAEVGDESTMVFGLGDSGSGWDGTYGHTLVDLSSFEDYRAKTSSAGMVEHALLSPRGSWAVVTSHGEYALCGGPPGFADVVAGRLAEPQLVLAERLVADWLDIGRNGGDVSWLEPMLSHVLGAKRANAIFRSAP